MKPQTGFLATMERESRARARALGSAQRSELVQRARDAAPARRLRLDPRGFDLLAELKRRSPANGVLATGGDENLRARARAYAAGGACALSVLTEPTRFDGALAHLGLARAASALPVMRKDFLVDPVQVLEARASGADGVLLVARLVPEALLSELLACAREHGLFVLVEAFDADDLARTLALRPREEETEGGEEEETGAFFVGVNARDLVTLAVEPQRALELARRIPRGLPSVAESGIERPSDARAAARAGFSLALVGTALMRAPDPRALVEELLAAGREERARCASV
jgi:indole-3-glycerol phosphate synthase